MSLYTQNEFTASVNGSVIVSLNDGAGNFPGGTTYLTASPLLNARGAWAVAAAHYDEDGFTDIAFTNEINRVTILFGDGNGVFDNPALPQATVPTLAEPYSVVAADCDLDGHIDIAVAKRIGNRIEVILNDADGDGDLPGGEVGDFAAPVAFATEIVGELHGLITADLNADGRPDLAVGIDPASPTPDVLLILIE